MMGVLLELQSRDRYGQTLRFGDEIEWAVCGRRLWLAAIDKLNNTETVHNFDAGAYKTSQKEVDGRGPFEIKVLKEDLTSSVRIEDNIS